MREITFDTETTGLDPDQGHRVVEIGCVELVDKIKTGRSYHAYINPQRMMPKRAEEVHGLGDEFLSDKPLFEDIAKEFVDFVADGNLIIHNAAFDMKFINFELEKVGFTKFSFDIVTDTLDIARKKFPGAKANLDALCKRFGIDLSRRNKHGALLDAELLADVYIELTGGTQAVMNLISKDSRKSANKKAKKKRPKRSYPVSEAELKNHQEFLQQIANHSWG